MTGEAELTGLLYRADWTRLRLSAGLADGSSVLVAPGRRYRRQDGAEAWGCDGERPWKPGPDGAGYGTVHWVSQGEPPLRPMLCPAWLLPGSRLEVVRPVRACGRDAIQARWSSRPSIRDRRLEIVQLQGDHAEVIVDAELGILLRLAWLDGGQETGVTELVRLNLSPVIDAALFAPPPGSLIGEGPGESPGGSGPAVWALKTAGGLVAGGLGAWSRYAPFPRGKAAASAQKAEAAMPPGDPAPGLEPDGRPAGPPVSAAVLHLLQASEAGQFAGTLHQWYDYSAMVSQVPAGARGAGFGGLGLLVDAIARQPGGWHQAAAVRVGERGEYQVDRAGELRRSPRTVTCDGQREWQVFAGKVTVGPARPAPPELADLADASWLLGCRLSGGELTTVDGRPGYRVSVTRGDAEWSWALLWFSAAVAVVDAERGILLRLTGYAGERPARRYELRDLRAEAGGFPAGIPPGLPVVEKARSSSRAGPEAGASGIWDEDDGSVDQAEPAARAPGTPVHLGAVVGQAVRAEAANAIDRLISRVGKR